MHSDIHAYIHSNDVILHSNDTVNINAKPLPYLIPFFSLTPSIDDEHFPHLHITSFANMQQLDDSTLNQDVE